MNGLFQLLTEFQTIVLFWGPTTYTLSETQIFAPENGWLEDQILLKKAPVDGSEIRRSHPGKFNSSPEKNDGWFEDCFPFEFR